MRCVRREFLTADFFLLTSSVGLKSYCDLRKSRQSEGAVRAQTNRKQTMNIIGCNAAAGGGSLDMTTILSNIAGGGVGGAILMAVVGIIKNKMAKN